MEILEIVGCPHCQGRLDAPDGSTDAWHCPTCSQQFAAAGQIPVLLREEDVAHFDRFARQYREARRQEGWPPLTLEQALALPYSQPAGYPPLYWEVRRQSFCTLAGILAREGPTPAQGAAADLGAGHGWLSYRLADLGYTVLAVDANRDSDWGLGAAERHYLPHPRLFLAQGDLEHPPLQAGRLGLILLNASLHYAMGLEGTLRRIARALQPGGRLVVLDTPIARRARPGTGRGDRHLGRQELQDALLAAGLTPRWVRVRRGVRWHWHQAKAWLRGDAGFAFPLVLADRRP